MNVLFVHQNFPGQFVHLAQAMKGLSGVRAVAITDAGNSAPDLVPTVRYRMRPNAVGKPHALAASFSARVARGERATRAMLALRARGFTPDLVLGHLGWGETLFVKDVWPETKLLVHAEFYYRAQGGDIDFDPEFATADPNRPFMIRAKNAAILMAMADADFGVAPTRWQGGRFPPFLQKKIAILHEGIDTDLAVPNPEARFKVPETDVELSRGDEVVTFVNRNLEPYRGYHVFMRALPDILAARPQARAVIVGGDGVSYGEAPKDGRSWKETLIHEVRDRLPLDRVHFVGKLPYPDLLDLLRVSAAHIYLTYPFVLSWSMLEAMSVGALVIASKTAPVEEVIRHGENGLLVDFFDRTVLAEAVIDALAAPERFEPLRQAARETIVDTYDMKRICLPKWLTFLQAITGAQPRPRREASSLQ